MKKEEILKAAIEKAERNDPLLCEKTGIMYCSANRCKSPHYLPPCMCNECACLNPHANIIIFNHDFAKAFWGEEIEDTMDIKELGWKYHLQQIVLQEYPVQYLEQFLTKKVDKKL